MRRLVVKLSIAAIGVGLGLICVLGWPTLWGEDSGGDKEKRVKTQYEGKESAPDFPEGLEWINTTRPIRMSELKGKVVLLDFWTYCCINCIHVLPDLKKLEHDFPDELVVVGVHSAKFEGEKVSKNIRQAVDRYEIEHAVVNDHEMKMWKEYGVRAWPTMALIDPAGKVVGLISGEGNYTMLKRFIGEMVQVFEERGEMDRRVLDFQVERTQTDQNRLLFPGKVLADAKSGKLFIADSNHNRIVVVSLEGGAIEAMVGSGQEGLADGDFKTAQFNHPQGMAFDGKILYVADTENHLIREIDFTTGQVRTIAGTGHQARVFNVSGKGLKTGLNSPWDLELHQGVLYIAMAGSHQLWQMDLQSSEVSPYAGSGREARIDGGLLQSALAQPSGWASDGLKLYFADSEISAIRSAELKTAGRVETIVGGDLFDFGDYLVYGTDSDREHNAVIRLDKATGRIERLQELNGSCIYACRFGGLFALTTTVEPSRANRSQDACLWPSRDGERWCNVFSARKDRWPPRYLQFGSLVLPRGAGDKEVILFSGQAVKDLDGKAVVARLAPGTEL